MPARERDAIYIYDIFDQNIYFVFLDLASAAVYINLHYAFSTVICIVLPFGRDLREREMEMKSLSAGVEFW